MAQHTKGAWNIVMVDNGESDDEIFTVINGCMVNIAAVFGAGEYSEARPNGEPEPHYEVSKEEASANARLLVAAPKLLLALQCLITEAELAGINSWALRNAQQSVAEAMIYE